MPRYEYKCGNGHVTEANRLLAHRDDVFWCPECRLASLNQDGERERFIHSSEMAHRVPSAPAFVVTGFNAQNGYSK